MLRKLWRKMLSLWVTGAAGVALTSAGSLYAQDNSDLEALKARLERIERQNDELRNKLDSAVSTTTDPGTQVDAASVERIVAGFMQKEEEKKKAAAAAPGGSDYQEVGKDLNMKVTWKDGLNFETPLKDFKVHVGGRAQYDMGVFTADPFPIMPVYNDAAGFRRARLRVDGTCWEVVSWVVEFDFATPDSTNVSSSFTDVYVDVNQLPIIGTFRAGHWKVPFSMEEITSSRYLNTLERSLLNNAFTPSRRLGLGFLRTFGDDERASFSAGFFRNTRAGNAGFDSGDGEYLYGGRMTFLPIWENNGRCLLHVGGAYCHQMFNNSDNPDPAFASRMELRLGTPLLLNVNSGQALLFGAGGNPLATSESVDLWGAEIGANWGPFNFMSEAMMAQCNNDNQRRGPNPQYWGYYLQGSYFLTGEHRPYNRKTGAWDRVKPHENFFFVRNGEDCDRHSFLCGRGAWELVARYSHLDLETNSFGTATGADSTGGSGILNDFTLGVNWYWNPNFKWQLNYVHALRNSDTPNRSGTADGVAFRFAWDF